jgi:ArsR family transcriptional regulator, arsenate/arsenite/antimonite-responsive transcriptional repressor
MRQFIHITKALSDETRVRALMLLQNGELCVCQIIEMLRLAPSTVSKHLTILLQADLVQRRKEGIWHYYRLADPPANSLVGQSLEWVLSSLKQSPEIAEDQKRLAAIRRQNKEALCECYKN